MKYSFADAGWSCISSDYMADETVLGLRWIYTETKKIKLHHVSRAQVVVENASGWLKGRWRSLLKRNDSAVEFLPTYGTACCVLHNICELYNDSFEEDWLVNEAISSEQAHRYHQLPLPVPHQDPHWRYTTYLFWQSVTFQTYLSLSTVYHHYSNNCLHHYTACMHVYTLQC